MAEKKNNIYKLLTNSYFYNFTQFILGATNFRKQYIYNLKIKKNSTILDIGSGTSTILNYLDNPKYYAYDINHSNIEFAKKKFGRKGVFKNKKFTNKEIINLPKFDYIFLFGVIHHMSNEEVTKLLKMLKRCLKTDGCLCSIDGVYLKKQNFLAKYLLKKDRGKHVRTKSEYNKIVNKSFTFLKTKIVHWKLFPYTYITIKMKKLSYKQC